MVDGRLRTIDEPDAETFCFSALPKTDIRLVNLIYLIREICFPTS